jgi:hypothetical protein
LARRYSDRRARVSMCISDYSVPIYVAYAHPHGRCPAHLDTCSPAQTGLQLAASCPGLAVSGCSPSLSIPTLGILAVSLVFRLFSQSAWSPAPPDMPLTQYEEALLGQSLPARDVVQHGLPYLLLVRVSAARPVLAARCARGEIGGPTRARHIAEVLRRSFNAGGTALPCRDDGFERLMRR